MSQVRPNSDREWTQRELRRETVREAVAFAGALVILAVYYLALSVSCQ